MRKRIDVQFILFGICYFPRVKHISPLLGHNKFKSIDFCNICKMRGWEGEGR